MSEQLVVLASSTLLVFLQARLPDWSRNKLKARLQRGHVAVNGAVVTGHAFALAVGDVVAVGSSGASTQVRPGRSTAGHGSQRQGPREPGAGITVIFCDPAIVVIDKPAGLLSVSTHSEQRATALALVRRWLGARERLWPVNRIDRETSGLLLFARSHELREQIQGGWADETQKTYLAVVQGVPDPPEGWVDQPLLEVDRSAVRVDHTPAARSARTHYRVIDQKHGRSLIELQLETGRRHQIRVHLAWLGHPVVGDARYGGHGAPRMGLHAVRLQLLHPTTGARLDLASPVPAAFRALLSGDR